MRPAEISAEKPCSLCQERACSKSLRVLTFTSVLWGLSRFSRVLAPYQNEISSGQQGLFAMDKTKSCCIRRIDYRLAEPCLQLWETICSTRSAGARSWI